MDKPTLQVYRLTESDVAEVNEWETRTSSTVKNGICGAAVFAGVLFGAAHSDFGGMFGFGWLGLIAGTIIGGDSRARSGRFRSADPYDRIGSTSVIEL